MGLGEIISKTAPVLGGFLAGGPVGAGAAVLKMVASEFEVEPTETAVEAAIKGDPKSAVKLRQIEQSNKEALTKMHLENETTRLIETQKTMREEIKSEDWFVKRARPSLIWAVSGSVILEILVGAFVVLVKPDQMASFVSLCSAISIPQGVAAAMCGVYMKQRSSDKAVDAGHTPGPGLLAGLLKRQ